MSKQLKFPSLRWNSSRAVVSVVIWTRTTFSQNQTCKLQSVYCEPIYVGLYMSLLSVLGVHVLDIIACLLPHNIGSCGNKVEGVYFQEVPIQFAW